MRPYADTNFFTRLYLRIPGHEETARLFNHAGKPLPVSWLHRLETINAFQVHVFASRHPGHTHITPEQAAAAHASFRNDLEDLTFLRSVQLEAEELEEQFEALSLRHTHRHGFRTYDLIHVASALLLNCDTFWSFDAKASRLAALEGLKIL